MWKFRTKLGLVGILLWGLWTLAGCLFFPSQPVVDFQADPMSGAAPRLIDFTPIIEGDVVAYAWIFGDGSTSTEAAPSHIYRKQGTYTVSLTVYFSNGKSRETTKEDLIDIGSPSFSGPGGVSIYWLDQSAGTIHAGSPDGSVTLTLVTGVSGAQYIAADSEWIYWTTKHTVKRASLSDGTGQETLYTNWTSTIGGLAVDTGAQRLYWTCYPTSISTNGGIWKANLDGSNQRLWGSMSGWAGNSHVPWILAVDSVSQRLYWFEHFFDVGGSGPILPVSLETGSVTPSEWTPKCSVHWTSVTSFDDHVIRENLPASEGLALDVGLPVVGSRYVYWTDPRSNEIVRCKPDGSEYRTILSDLDDPVALAMDAAYGKLYWSDSEGIHRADLDGTDPELVFPGAQADALVLLY